MSKLLKNIISIPVAYIMFALLFIIADIIFGIIYHYISYQVLAIIPTAIIWIVLQCLASKYLLRKLISNGIYYLISQTLVLVYIIFIKYSSYLWYLMRNLKYHLICNILFLLQNWYQVQLLVLLQYIHIDYCINNKNQ